MSECNSGDHPLSVAVVVVVVALNMFYFFDFFSQTVWVFLGWTPTKFVEIGDDNPIFNGIVGIFLQISANS